MSVLFTTTPAKRLSRTLLAAGSAIFLENIKGWNDEDLAAADFGTQLYAVLRDAGNTVMELMEVDPATVASDNGITIVRRGLAFTGDRTTELGARKLNWTKNTTIVELGSCSPQDLQYLKDYIDAIAISGSPDASLTAKGIVEIATTADIDADEDLGATGASLAVRPDQLVLSKYGTRLPSADQKAALAGSAGSPSSANKYLTEVGSSIDSVDQSQLTQNGTFSVGEADATAKHNDAAQSFIPTKTILRGVSLNKQANTGTFAGDVVVALQADTAGSPSGVNLASKTIPNALYNAYATGEFLALFSAEVAVTPGSLYWIVVNPSTSDNSNYMNLGTNTAGSYASGSVKYRNTTDGWVAVATIDFYFKVHEGGNGKAIVADSTGFLPLGFRKTTTKVGKATLAAGATTTVAHGLGKIPSKVMAEFMAGTSGYLSHSRGFYDVAAGTYAAIYGYYNEGSSGAAAVETTNVVRTNPAASGDLQTQVTITAIDENVVIFSLAGASSDILYEISA